MTDRLRYLLRQCLVRGPGAARVDLRGAITSFSDLDLLTGELQYRLVLRDPRVVGRETAAATHVAGVGQNVSMATAFAVRYHKHCFEYGHARSDDEVPSKGTVYLPNAVDALPLRWRDGSVILFTDAISDGADELQACRRLEDAGLRVARVASVTDYGLGARESLERGGYRVTVLAPLSEVI